MLLLFIATDNTVTAAVKIFVKGSVRTPKVLKGLYRLYELQLHDVSRPPAAPLVIVAEREMCHVAREPDVYVRQVKHLGPRSHSQTAGSWPSAKFESYKCRLKIDFLT